MRGLALILAIFSALSYTPPVSAAFKSGNDIVSDCKAGEAPQSNHLRWGACMGYIIGAADSIGFWSAVVSGESCIPTTAQAGQIKDIVLKFLDENPAQRHFEAHALVYAALKKAFNCPLPIGSTAAK